MLTILKKLGELANHKLDEVMAPKPPTLPRIVVRAAEARDLVIVIDPSSGSGAPLPVGQVVVAPPEAPKQIGNVSQT